MTAADVSISFNNSSRHSGEWAIDNTLVGQFVDLMPLNPEATVLEIGCSSGGLGALALETGRAGTCVGIEADKRAAARAGTRLTEVIIGDFETSELPWCRPMFDVVVISNAFGHAVQPWRILERARPILKPSGLVLARVSNASHWRAISAAVVGRTGVLADGTFDRALKRRFTPRAMRAIFEDSGFEVTGLSALSSRAFGGDLISKIMFGQFDHLLMNEFCLQARLR